MSSSVDPAIIETLRKYDSATIANVIELFDIRSRVSGYTGSNIKAIYPELPPAVGTAITATFRSGYPATKGDAYGDMGKLMEFSQRTPGPKVVVFQDLDVPSRAATYGEMMATAFQAFGFVGLITSGTARDIEQVRALRFPCFASGVLVSHGHCRITEIGVPVQVDGLEVRTGNLIHADANGVIDVPVALAGEIAKMCQPFVDAEDIVLKSLRTPNPTVDGYKKAVTIAHDRMAALGEQARAVRDRITR